MLFNYIGEPVFSTLKKNTGQKPHSDYLSLNHLLSSTGNGNKNIRSNACFFFSNKYQPVSFAVMLKHGNFYQEII